MFVRLHFSSTEILNEFRSTRATSVARLRMPGVIPVFPHTFSQHNVKLSTATSLVYLAYGVLL
jgi:hypothetical protein